MNRPTTHLIAILIACAMLIFSPAVAVSIQMVPASVTVQKSATTEIALVLDDAPSGLAGYDLEIRFSNPGIAKIDGVTYPSWAQLNNTTTRSDGTVRISGVDLSRQVSPGAMSTLLATLTIQGISGGSSSIILGSVNMDADGGDLIIPALPTGQITVPGGSIAPSGGGGGGSSSSQVTQSTTSPTPTPMPTTTQLQSPPTSSPIFTEEPSQPSATPTDGSIQSRTSVTGLPDMKPGIPWTWIYGGMIVLGAMILGAFVAWRREQEED